MQTKQIATVVVVVIMLILIKPEGQRQCSTVIWEAQVIECNPAVIGQHCQQKIASNDSAQVPEDKPAMQDKNLVVMK